MNAQEIASFVISRWLMEHTAEAIGVQLLCLGCPMKKAEILQIVRRYVDSQTENTDLPRRR